MQIGFLTGAFEPLRNGRLADGRPGADSIVVSCAEKDRRTHANSGGARVRTLLGRRTLNAAAWWRESEHPSCYGLRKNQMENIMVEALRSGAADYAPLPSPWANQQLHLKAEEAGGLSAGAIFGLVASVVVGTAALDSHRGRRRRVYKKYCTTMSIFTNSPYVLKAASSCSTDHAQVQRNHCAAIQPDTLHPFVQVQAVSEEAIARKPLVSRTAGRNVQSRTEIDATDQLETAQKDGNRTVIDHGIHPQIAVLEAIVYPRALKHRQTSRSPQTGTLEMHPLEAPLTLFVWSAKRILPVRLTEFSVTEEAFDTKLNPIRARLVLGMRAAHVTTISDLPRRVEVSSSPINNKRTHGRVESGRAFGALALEVFHGVMPYRH